MRNTLLARLLAHLASGSDASRKKDAAAQWFEIPLVASAHEPQLRLELTTDRARFDDGRGLAVTALEPE